MSQDWVSRWHNVARATRYPSLEFGALKNENPWQGSHFIEWLTDEVEPVTRADTLLPYPFSASSRS